MRFTLLDFLFPMRCVGCGSATEQGVAVCKACVSTISMHTSLFCGKCRSRLPYQKKVCHRDSPYILGAAADYRDDVIQKLIVNLKFQNVRSAALPLAELLAKYVRSLNLSDENVLVIPVPLAKRRERKRGFNQADLIGKRFAEIIGLPYRKEVLLRQKETPPQSEIHDRAVRRENVRDCFTLTEPERVAGKNIFLIDDVTTSGATFEEAARALRLGGAKSVLALATAKA